MKPRSKLPVRVSGLLPTMLAALLALYRPAALDRLDAGVYDTLVRAAPTRPPDPRVVIVDVDERSLSSVGQWPWRRDVIGDLITNLRDRGAAAVALDVIFAESDRSEAPGTRGVSSDEALATRLREGHVVLGYAFTFDERRANAVSACVQHPLSVAIVQRGEEPNAAPFFSATGAICSLPLLTAAAGASGFLNAAPDPDGLLRRAPLLMQFDDRIYPSLALATVLAVEPATDRVLQVATVNSSSLSIGDPKNAPIPLDGKANLLLHYRGPRRTFPYVSASDVLSGAVADDKFANKLVFVGTTALGTREVVSTPLDTLFAGVEVQATLADNLLQRDFIRRPGFAVAVEAQLVLLLGIAAALLVGRFGIVWGAAASALILAATWAVSFGLMANRGIVLSPLYPTLGLVASLFVIGVTWFALEHRRANRADVAKTTSQRLMVKSLLSLTTVRDAETGEHSRRTERYTRALAQALASHPRFRTYLTPETIDLLATLAPLHDIGKVGVPDQVLNKPGALTDAELLEMRKHPSHGRTVILNAERDAGVHDDEILTMAKDIVYSHHEKWDGTGYPEGLSGDRIPIPGRIIAIVDVYDAVLTRRLYRETMSHQDAVAFIRKGAGTHFDPDVVDAFVRIADALRSDA
ncbi:MAG TPA: CHASE2 domain-containing protein [Vicinamibacterales bacterium]|jgi:adenylate cyclase|nr:CHASE2 domain-containing protein [Vicinamibacterales bacterium]